jgi:hypothetical protein
MKGSRVSLGAALRAVVVLAVLALLGYLSVRFADGQRDRKAADQVPAAGSAVAPGGSSAAAAEFKPADFLAAVAPEKEPDPVAAVPAEPAATAATAAVGPAPAVDGLRFERTVVAVEVAADAREAVTDFPFTNGGGKVVTIREVEKDCDCAEVQISNGKLSYAPGEAGIIRARFRLDNLVGTVEKSFQLFLEGDRPDQPTHLLVARIQIPVLIELSAKTVDWTVGGKPEPRTVEVRVTHDQPIHLRNAVSSRDDLRVTLKTVEDGRRYELLLEPSAVDQPGLALIRLETDSTIPRWKLLQVFARFLPAGVAPTQPAAP